MAWLFQDHRQKQKHGDKKAPWSVGWIDPDGKTRSKKIGSQSMAKKFQRKVEGQLASNTYQDSSRRSWQEFRREYEQKILSGMAPVSQTTTKIALNHFERLVKPKRVSAITTAIIDGYIADRRTERGLKPGSTVSPVTVNRELRHLKAVFNIADEWGCLGKVPKVRFLREPEKAPRYVPSDHFAAIYESCDVAKRPADYCEPAEWWHTLLVTSYMTGWRIGETLDLRRDHLDLKAGVAELVARETKGKRGERIPLHAIVVEHLAAFLNEGAILKFPGAKMRGAAELVFPLSVDRRMLWDEFLRIQQAAGIHLPCDGDHQHTPSCHVYGFHDFRRAFATENAASLSADALQRLMRHKHYTTTQRYINMAEQLNRSVDGLHVPDFLRDPTQRAGKRETAV